jgi:Cu/Zn superoxide dismutase
VCAREVSVLNCPHTFTSARAHTHTHTHTHTGARRKKKRHTGGGLKARAVGGEGAMTVTAAVLKIALVLLPLGRLGELGGR